MLVSRAPAESLLYLALHPCDCGTRELVPEHQLEERDNLWVAVYAGPCPGCGQYRRFEFAIDEEEPPPGAVFGGDRPSQILDPGQFHHASDRAAARVPVDLSRLPPHRWPAARDDMRYAVAGIEEVAKFLPPGAEAVPAEAFRSRLGRAMRRSRPDRFQRERIEDRLRFYRHTLAELQYGTGYPLAAETGR